MTDEQIKRNAKEYASTKEMHSPRSQDVELDKLMIIEDYIAGAHSRDEEIKEFEERIKVLDMNLVEQQLENQHLLNPWIKPSEQMPVDGDDIVYLLYEGKAGRMKYHSTYEKWLRESATHWMKVTLKED